MIVLIIWWYIDTISPSWRFSVCFSSPVCLLTFQYTTFCPFFSVCRWIDITLQLFTQDARCQLVRTSYSYLPSMTWKFSKAITFFSVNLRSSSCRLPDPLSDLFHRWENRPAYVFANVVLQQFFSMLDIDFVKTSCCFQAPSSILFLIFQPSVIYPIFFKFTPTDSKIRKHHFHS